MASTVERLQRKQRTARLHLEVINARLEAAEHSKRAEDWASRSEQMRLAAKQEAERADAASRTLRGVIVDVRKILSHTDPTPALVELREAYKGWNAPA